MDNRTISLQRAAELKSKTLSYKQAKKQIPNGLKEEEIKKYNRAKAKMFDYFNVSDKEWDDYKWQLKNRISDVETLKKLVDLSDEEIQAVSEIADKYRWSISPYYLALIDFENKLDPIKLQAVPCDLENIDVGITDPMSEEYTNPAGSITRRYPDRLIINVTNVCPMYCRHCQRRRKIGSLDHHQTMGTIRESIEYIRNNEEIRDVLITGGDPLTMSDEMIELVLKELREIKHVEIIRIGTRTLVTLPQRITPNLVSIFKKYHPLYINAQYNHPKEITPEAKKACGMLADIGIPLGNQAVLLNGINNDKFVMASLNHLLLQIRVKPYYIFHAKEVIGTTHFNTSIEDGLEIMEYLRGNTSGMAIPTYIINAPGGLGKTPILPQYILDRNDEYYTLRTWEGNVLKYKNHPTVNLEEMIDNKKTV